MLIVKAYDMKSTLLKDIFKYFLSVLKPYKADLNNLKKKLILEDIVNMRRSVVAVSHCLMGILLSRLRV